MRWQLFVIFLLSISLANAVDIDERVENELLNNENVDVIITFSDRSKFLSNNFDANNVIANLDRKDFRGEYFGHSKIAAGKINRNGLERLKLNNNVENIYFDYKVRITLNQSVKMINSTIVNNLRVKGSYNLTGKNVGVCVLDTGVNYSLSSLGGGLGEGRRVVSGYDYVNSDTNPADDNGHGTHVAGIVAGNGTVTGVAPEAHIFALKVLDSGGGGSISNVINGIQWCIDNSTKYNISVITMSLSCGTFDSACDSSTNCNADLMKGVVNDAVGKNISVIASSGNNGDGTMTSGNFTHIGLPSCLSNVTSVGAVDDDFTISGYGNRNNLTLLMAPGTSIKSLAYGGTCLSSCSCSGETMQCDGTSMAAPHVAGAYALMLQYLRDENNSIMKNYQLKDVFNKTGRNTVDSTTNLNYRIIDVYKALIELDNYGPDVKISYPENKTYKVANLTFNFSAVDVNFNSSWYSLNGNANVSVSKNTTLSIANGSQVLTFYSNDTKGNLNSTSVSFVVNTSLPTLSQNLPDNASTDSDDVALFNCSATSSIGLKNMSLLHNISGTFKINETKEISGLSNNSIFSFNSTDIKFIWNCLVYDTNEAYAFGDNRSLTMKLNNKPNITSYLPSNLTQTMDEGSNLSFNHSSSDVDNNALSFYWLLNNEQKSTSQNFTYSPNYTESGSYNLSLVVSDTIVNTSLNWTLTVSNKIVCGNNIKETDEDCDGSDLNSKTCTTQGFTGGTLSCSSTCTFVTSSCTNSSSSGGGGNSGGGGGSGGGGTPISEFDTSELLTETQAAKPKEETPVQTQTPVSVTVEKANVDKEEETINIIKGESVGFILDEAEHKITLNEVRENEVDITINSKTVKLTLKLTEEKEADIDDDNLNDIRVKLEGILDGEATFKVIKLQEGEGAKGITGKFFDFVPTDGIKSYGAGILGLLFILLFGFKMFKRKKKG